MARTLTNAKLDSRSSRQKLAARNEPYWQVVDQGRYLGYRKGKNSGRWVAKLYSAYDGRKIESIATADDTQDANGLDVLNFSQAQSKARELFLHMAKVQSGDFSDGNYTVKQAVDDYMADYQRRSDKATSRIESMFNKHILPELENTPIKLLTKRRLDEWLGGIIKIDPAELEAGNRPEIIRKRKVLANRILNQFKAVLNRAYNEGYVTDDQAWRRLKTFKGVNEARIRFLTDAETVRLINACPTAFRKMASAALLTGCRYGELTALQCGDLDLNGQGLHICMSKSGKSRFIALTDEAMDFFRPLAIGRPSNELMLKKEGGQAWCKNHQQRPLKDACKAAKIAPAINFHILRHTYAARLAMNSVPIKVIAEQLGHADTRITEKHYAHLCGSYVADMIRAKVPTLGIVESSNIYQIA